jgi:formate dehydrogenase iron-sulfur subunit
MIACTVENTVPMNDTYIWVAGRDVMGEYPELTRGSMPYHCMHCLAPDCVSACPVGAWYKREDGPVLYDEKRCIGCRYCMNACPFSVPHFDWDKGLLDGALMHKCTMCQHRLEVGQEPACVQTCPTGALKFGDRADLIAEAHARIGAHPGRYIDHVYGEIENGGTSYLILSHVPFTDLGLPEIGAIPVKNVSEEAMGVTIPLALGWGAVLTGITAGVQIKHRRQEAAATKTASEADTDSGEEQ